MKVTIKTERSTELVNSSGVTTVTMRESSKITISMDKEPINGLTEECMSANGNLTKCTGKVYSPGRMEDNTKGKQLYLRPRLTV